MQVFKIIGSLSSPEGSVWEVGSQSEGWKTLEPGESIMGDNFMRLNVSSQTSSGVAWFDVEENSGDKQHFIFILKSINAYLLQGFKERLSNQFSQMCLHPYLQQIRAH